MNLNNRLNFEESMIDSTFIIQDTKAVLIDDGHLDYAAHLSFVYLTLQSYLKQILTYEKFFQDLYEKGIIQRIPARYHLEQDLTKPKEKLTRNRQKPPSIGG